MQGEGESWQDASHTPTLCLLGYRTWLVQWALGWKGTLVWISKSQGSPELGDEPKGRWKPWAGGSKCPQKGYLGTMGSGELAHSSLSLEGVLLPELSKDLWQEWLQ